MRMKVKKVRREDCKKTVKYSVVITDRHDRLVDIVFRLNKAHKKYRPEEIFVNGRSYGFRLREFLDENRMEHLSTEPFMQLLARKTDEILERKKARKSNLQVV